MTFAQSLVASSTSPLVLAALLALVGIWLAARGHAADGARLVAAVVVATVAAHLLKLLANDPRPAGGLVPAWGSGWPSAHAAVGAAAAVALWSAVRPRRPGHALAAFLLAVALAAAALLLAASRLYLGVHDLGDVLGGLAVGFLAAAFCLRALRARETAGD